MFAGVFVLMCKGVCCVCRCLQCVKVCVVFVLMCKGICCVCRCVCADM